MAIQYMDDGFAPHVDRGFSTAKTRLEPSRLSFHQDDETEKHARAMVEHVLALEAERVPAVTAELLLRRLPWRTPFDNLREKDPLRRSAPVTSGKS